MALKNKLKSIKIRLIIILALAILSFIITSYKLSNLSKKKIRFTIKNEDSKMIPNVLVHIDLKGSPPKLSYLQSLLPMLREFGATGLLIEYEDMFPYRNNLANLSAPNSYKKSQLRRFLLAARRHHFEIIPLIQTFGHMEYVLKLQEFKHLRESPSFMDSICPSKPQSLKLVADIIEQVVEFHAHLFPLKYIHIGCDEVYHINMCNICSNRSVSTPKIYLDHIKNVADIVNKSSPNTAVLVWDDMLRTIPMTVWTNLKMSKIQPVYWEYGKKISVSHVNMMKYHLKFENIWIASAFKGADGRYASLPNIWHRFLNHYQWMKFIEHYKFGGESVVYKFKGIIMTGWSRYGHTLAPCELLPVALPSLILNLALVKYCNTEMKDNVLSSDLKYMFNNYIRQDVIKALNCTDITDIKLLYKSNCEYDGIRIYRNLNDMKLIEHDLKSLDAEFSYVKYYVNINNTDMLSVDNYWNHFNRTLNKLEYLKLQMTKNLRRFYDKYFTDEYVNFKMYQILKPYNHSQIFKDKLKIDNWLDRFYRPYIKRNLL